MCDKPAVPNDLDEENMKEHEIMIGGDDDDCGSVLDSARSFGRDDESQNPHEFSEDYNSPSAFKPPAAATLSTLRATNLISTNEQLRRLASNVTLTDDNNNAFYSRSHENGQHSPALFAIQPSEVDAFGEYLDQEIGSKAPLEFYLASQALQDIPDDDDFLKKSIKSMYRLFVRKYLRNEAVADSDNYVSMRTLQLINDNISNKRLCNRNVFQPAVDELSVVLDRKFKEFSQVKRLREASARQHRLQQQQHKKATPLSLFVSEPEEEDMNAILEEHCARVFKSDDQPPLVEASGQSKKCEPRHGKRARSHRNATAVIGQTFSRQQQADFCRSVSSALMSGANNNNQQQQHHHHQQQQSARQRAPANSEKRHDDRMISAAAKRTFNGVHRPVLPHSKSAAVIHRNNPRQQRSQAPPAHRSPATNRPDHHHHHQDRNHQQHHQRETPTNETTRRITVVYYLPGEAIPFMTPYSGDRITLAQFKSSIVCKRLENCKFFFKTKIDLDECQVVFKEVNDPIEYLPLFDQKIIAKIERCD